MRKGVMRKFAGHLLRWEQSRGKPRCLHVFQASFVYLGVGGQNCIINPRKTGRRKNTKDRLFTSSPCIRFWCFFKSLNHQAFRFKFNFFLLKLAFESITLFQQMAQFSLKLLSSFYLGKYQSYLRLPPNPHPVFSVRSYSVWLMKFCEKIKLDYLLFFFFFAV